MLLSMALVLGFTFFAVPRTGSFRAIPVRVAPKQRTAHSSSLGL